jgi:streptogramin lyase
VTDAILNRVQEFTAAGAFILQFGSTGTAPGFLNHPYGIAISPSLSGNVWVVDTGNNRLEEFNPTGGFIQALGGLGGGNGQFNSPIGISIDRDDDLWVADTGNYRIQQFYENPGGPPMFQLEFGAYGNGNGQFRAIFSIANDASEPAHVYVADAQNQRILQFSHTGGYIQSFVGPFSYPSPYAVAVDGSGNLWTLDYNSNQVLEFNSSGTKILTFGTVGGGPGQLYHPTVIAVH